MNPLNDIHGNKFIHEMLPTALICHPKAPKVLMQLDMPFDPVARRRALLSDQSRQMRLSTLPYGTKAQSLRRSVDLNIGRTALKFFGSDLWSSLIVFGTIWRIQLLLQKVVNVIGTSIFAPKPEVCEMDGNFRLQKDWLVHVRQCPKRHIKLY